MKRSVLALLLPILATGAVACDDDPISESADLKRPAGLLYVPREMDTAADTERGDVWIVDSEAQGVRIRQTFRDGSVRSERFVPAPAIFFPLVVPAPGFPTRAAASPDGLRAFVISPASVGIEESELDGVSRAVSRLHVLDIPPIGRFDRIGADDHVRLGDVDLTALISGAFIPVDIVTIGAVGDIDRVAIAFDEVGAASSKIVVVDMPQSIERRPDTTVDKYGHVQPMASVEYDIAGGTRALLLKDGLLYATTGSSTIAVVDPDAGPIGTLDAGGPTHDLLDAGDYGLLALRTDRASVVVFVPDPNGTGLLVRSTTDFTNLFSSRQDRLDVIDGAPDALGRIDLRPSPLGPGAFSGTARAKTRWLILQRPDGVDLGAVLALVTHADGFASWILDPDTNLATTPSDASRLRVADYDSATIDYAWQRERIVPFVIEGCTVSIGGEDPVDVSGCNLLVAPTPGDRRYRAAYQGALVRAARGTLSSATAGVWSLVDTSVVFADRQVRVGDRVLLHPGRISADLSDAEQARCAAMEVPTSTVVAVREVAGNTLVVDFAGALPDCPVGVYLYEVYPSGDEAVLVEVATDGGTTVLERVPSSTTAAGYVFGSEPASPLPMTLTTGGFVCGTPRLVSEATERGHFCGATADCAVGWSCTDPDGVSSDGPSQLARCVKTACDAGADCLQTEEVRTCPVLEVLVGRNGFIGTDLKDDTDSTVSALSAAPDDAISVDAQGGFMVSFPGARSVVQIRLSVADDSLVVDQVR